MKSTPSPAWHRTPPVPELRKKQTGRSKT
jgi:hypothetical protein